MSESKFIDLAANLKGSAAFDPPGGKRRRKDATTTLYLALMHDGRELEASGYHRHQVDFMRSLFIPSSGKLVLEVHNLDFGQVMHPVTVDGFALTTQEAIISTQALPNGPERFGPMQIRVQKVRLFNIPLFG